MLAVLPMTGLQNPILYTFVWGGCRSVCVCVTEREKFSLQIPKVKTDCPQGTKQEKAGPLLSLQGA